MIKRALQFLVMFSMLFLSDIPNSVSNPPDVVVSKETKKLIEKNEMSVAELVDIFTKKKTHWDDRTEIVVVTRTQSSVQHQIFLNEVFGITPYQYRSRLERNIYQGRSKPPIQARSEEELVEIVLSKKGAIGYIYDYIVFKQEDRLVIIHVSHD